MKVVFLSSSSADNPSVGREVAAGIREYSVAQTPFSLIYQVFEDRIEILRLWDHRADRSTLGSTDEGPH